MTNMFFAKMKDDAIIPRKVDGDAGYDVYANFPEDYLIIEPNQTKMIPTGICSMCDEEYYFQLFERGSTGSKGMGRRAGVIEGSYKGEWFIAITNHNNKPIVIYKKDYHVNSLLKDIAILYPYEKAIAQFTLLPVPKSKVVEVTREDILSIPSHRKDGCLGSSNK